MLNGDVDLRSSTPNKNVSGHFDVVRRLITSNHSYDVLTAATETLQCRSSGPTAVREISGSNLTEDSLKPCDIEIQSSTIYIHGKLSVSFRKKE